MLRKNVKYHRERIGMTQDELGDRLGVHRSMIAQWERGSRGVAEDHVPELSKIFGVSIDELYSDGQQGA